jgi:hypothetical protein
VVKRHCETVIGRDRQIGAVQEFLEDVIHHYPIKCPATEAPPLRGIPSFTMTETEAGAIAEMFQPTSTETDVAETFQQTSTTATTAATTTTDTAATT